MSDDTIVNELKLETLIESSAAEEKWGFLDTLPPTPEVLRGLQRAINRFDAEREKDRLMRALKSKHEEQKRWTFTGGRVR